MWEQSTKIIISDIDGTITKSDVRGMILPMIGRLLVHEHHYSIIYFVCWDFKRLYSKLLI